MPENVNPLYTPNIPIPIEGKIRENLEQQQTMFNVLVSDIHQKADYFAKQGIHAVKDSYGDIVPGVICLDTGKAGKSSSVIAMTHTNEPCGLSAQHELLQSWMAGNRPKSGKVYLMIGGNVAQGKVFFNRILDDKRAMTNSEISEYRGIKDINFNRIPERLLATSTPLNADEKRILQLREIFAKCEGSVLDLHSLSTQADPIAIAALSKYDDMEIKSSLSKLIERMPVVNVLVDMTKRMNGFMLSRIGSLRGENVPMVIEAGGPHIASHVAKNSTDCCNAWLENVAGWSQTKQYYDNTIAYYHPQIEPLLTPDSAKALKQSLPNEEALKAVRSDSFILIQGPETLEDASYWTSDASKKAAADIAKNEGHTLKSGRLLNFAYVEKGEPLMVGQQTGHVIRARESGFLLMGPANPVISPDQKESYILSAKNPEKEKTLHLDERSNVSTKMVDKLMAEKAALPLARAI